MSHPSYLLEISSAFFFTASQRVVMNYRLDARIYLFFVIYRAFYIFT